MDLNTHKLENYCHKIGAYSLCGQDLNWHKNGQHRNLEIKHPILLLVLVLTKLNWLKAMVQDKSAYNEKRWNSMHFFRNSKNYFTQCLKMAQKVAFNIASEASYVYNLSGKKLIKNAKNGEFLKISRSGQTCQFL